MLHFRTHCSPPYNHIVGKMSDNMPHFNLPPHDATMHRVKELLTLHLNTHYVVEGARTYLANLFAAVDADPPPTPVRNRGETDNLVYPEGKFGGLLDSLAALNDKTPTHVEIRVRTGQFTMTKGKSCMLLNPTFPKMKTWGVNGMELAIWSDIGNTTRVVTLC